MTDAKIIAFYDEILGSTGGGVPYLLGNIGDNITAVFQLDVHWESICELITNGSVLTRTDGGSFINDGFRLNDTFETLNCGINDATPYTIATITDKVITITGAFAANATYSPGEIHGTTQITALDYWYNINPYNNNLDSMTDVGNKQKYTINNLDAADTSTLKNFTPVGPSYAWAVHYTGIVPQIVGNGIANFVQSFLIAHYTMIVPLSLANQELNFQNKIPPSYFKGDNCLTWAGAFTAKTIFTDPCSPHTSNNIFCNGNTGWYNENFNGNPSDYRVVDIIYDAGGKTTIDACGTKTPVEINIYSNAGKFVAGQEIRLFFHWFAAPESSYQQTSTDYITNFHLDRVKLLEGGAPANGDYFGTNNQAIVNATFVVNTINSATLNFEAAFTTSFFEAGSKFVIGVIVQDPAVTTTAGSDRVTLLADFNTMQCNLTDPDYSKLMQEIEFFQHPKSASSGTTDINGIVGDIWLAKAFIGVKKSANIVFNAMDVAIEAVNSVSGARFDLERKSYNLKQFIPDANYIQAIDIRETRNWNTWTEYDYITFKHCPAMDDVDYAVYELNYPVRLMDETYRKLGAGGAYFQNPTNNWSQYSDNGDWDVKFNIYTEVEGQQIQVNLFEQDAIIRNYNEKGANIAFDFNIISIDTIKAGTGIDLKGVISDTGITMVKVNIAGDFTSFPTGFDGFYGVLGMCSVQTGSCDYASTNLKTDPNSVWLGIDKDTDPYIRLTITSNTTAILESLIDGNKLDKGIDPSTFYITAKIGYMVTEQLLAQENQAYILQENGFGILIN